MGRRRVRGEFSPGIPPALAWAGLVLINVFVYGSVSDFELVNWDDPTYITENPTVLQGLTWANAWWALTTGHSPYWHPLTWISHMIDVSLFGSDAGAYHVVNVVLHTANTLLLFELLRRMTGAHGRSAFVAAMFAAHPLHVESVAWVTERKDVLSTCFWLLASLAYLSYVRRGSWQRYVSVAVLFTLALMSKPMVVTLPVVFLLLDFWPLGRLSPGTPGWRLRARALVIEKLPLVALALATSVATVVIQHRVGAMAGLDALPWQARAGNASVGYVAYIWKTVWPAKLAAFYPLFDTTAARVVLAVCAMLAVTAAVIRFRARHPYLLTGWMWYVITIAPVIGFLQAGEQGMADRFMYIPMIGLLMAAAWAVPAILPGRMAVVRAAGIAVVVASAVAAHAQVAHWENSLTLWEHATRVTPDSYIAYQNFLGMLFARHLVERAPRRPEFHYREDRMFLLEVALQNPSLTMVPGCAGYWVQHPEQMQRNYVGVRSIVANYQLLAIYRRILRELQAAQALSMRRRRAAAPKLWTLAHWMAYADLDEACRVVEWIHELNTDFSPPESGALGVAYRKLGFRWTERLLRLRRMLIAPFRRRPRPFGPGTEAGPKGPALHASRADLYTLPTR